MGARPGRPAQSAKVIELRGNRSKLSKKEIAERDAAEVKPRPVSTKAPADLSPDELECWNLHASELNALGLLTVLDIASFRLLVCQPYEMAKVARASMLMQPTKKDGTPDGRRKPTLAVVAEDTAHGGGLKRHPAFLVWKQSLELYRMGCAHFGLTPSSRVGLRPGAPVGAGHDDDDDDEFFGT